MIRVEIRIADEGVEIFKVIRHRTKIAPLEKVVEAYKSAVESFAEGKADHAELMKQYHSETPSEGAGCQS